MEGGYVKRGKGLKRIARDVVVWKTHCSLRRVMGHGGNGVDCRQLMDLAHYLRHRQIVLAHRFRHRQMKVPVTAAAIVTHGNDRS